MSTKSLALSNPGGKLRTEYKKSFLIMLPGATVINVVSAAVTLLTRSPPR